MKVIKDLICLLLPVVVHLMQTTGTGLNIFGFFFLINVLFIELYLALHQHFSAKVSFSGIWNVFLPGANNILPCLKLSKEISSNKNTVCALLAFAQKRRETNFLLPICSVHFHTFIFVTTIRTCFDRTFSSVFLVYHSRDHIEQAIYIPSLPLVSLE